MAGQENQQYTVLYGRLSQEDERAGESNSIQHQEKIGLYLAEAEKRGLLAAFYLELTTGLRRGGTAGPPMDGLRCREQNAFHHETGEPHQRGISGKPSENEKFYSHIGPSTAGSRSADCRAQKAPSQSVSVPIAQDRDYV